jgi:FHA domain-containing protein
LSEKRADVPGPNSPNQSDTLRLVALGAAAPRVLELRSARVTVGTAASNDLLLDEPTASRRHAALERRGGRWHVADLGSTNGTYINGRRVTAPTPLQRGDELRFANARFACVAPGDDLSKVGAGSEKTGARSRGRGVRRASAIAAVLLCAVGGFALTAYLLHAERRGPAAEGLAAKGAASPSAASSTRGALGAAAATPAAIAVAPGAPSGAPGATALPPWLARLNHYRSLAGLPPVAEDPALSEGDALHARYLVKSYAEAIRRGGIGGEAHEENRASPWYTAKGADAGKASDVSYWQAGKGPPAAGTTSDSPDSPDAMPWGSPGWSIDGWVGIPFHRLSLLSPYLRRTGFGRYCEDSGCAAALDTLSERNRLPEYPVPFAHPLEFPPSGTTIGILSLDSEWPDPLTGCPGYARPAGLAITLEVGAEVDARLGAYSLTRDGASSVGSGAKLDACGFDASSYVNPEAAAQRRARDILHGFGAVVMIPRAPLERGASYTVSMTVNGQQYKWSFSTVP